MSMQAVKSAVSGRGRTIVLRYLAVSAGLNVVWEIGQLPLYMIWRTGSPRAILFAIVHCTLGDVLIAAGSFFLALLLIGRARHSGRLNIGLPAVVAVFLGIAYTVFSEWLNVSVRGSWAYAPTMPVIPPLEIGLTPLLQWVAIPPLAFALTRRGDNRAMHRSQ